MASKRDIRFHWTRRVRRHLKSAKHDVRGQCDTVKQLLSINPEYGQPVKGHGHLRKMRIHVPTARMGKSGGYRCIYRKALIDEIEYVVFLAVYFKGKVEDLTEDQYKTLEAEAEEVLKDPLGFVWEDPPVVHR